MVTFPHDFRIVSLQKKHLGKEFDSGELAVDRWLREQALQHQDKHLSATKVLLHTSGKIAGFYTLATGQVDFSDLPHEIVRKLPRRALPVAILAWLGVDREYQRQGLGERLLAQALLDCYEAGNTFAFVAVLIDCLNDAAKSFYMRWNFEELPGQPYRLFLSAQHLAAMMKK